MLIGKRNLNCLSCGKQEPPLQAVVGNDGRIYKASGIKHAKDTTIDINDAISTSMGERSRVASANILNRRGHTSHEGGFY